MFFWILRAGPGQIYFPNDGRLPWFAGNMEVDIPIRLLDLERNHSPLGEAVCQGILKSAANPGSEIRNLYLAQDFRFDPEKPMYGFGCGNSLTYKPRIPRPKP